MTIVATHQLGQWYATAAAMEAPLPRLMIDLKGSFMGIPLLDSYSLGGELATQRTARRDGDDQGGARHCTKRHSKTNPIAPRRQWASSN